MLKDLCMKIFKTFMKEMFKRHKRKHISYLLTGMKTDTQINRAEQQSQKETHTLISQLPYEKGAKNIWWGKDKLFKNSTGKNGQCYEKTKMYPCL